MSTREAPTAPAGSAAGLLTRLVALPAGRRAKWAIVAIWLIVIAAVSPLAGQLADVEKNDAASFLPANAESLQARERLERFEQGETLDAVVVYHRGGGLTAADLALIAQHRQALAERFPASPPGPLQRSDDGQAAIYAIPLPAPKDADATTGDDVEAIRDLVDHGGDGLAIEVTGPAGFLIDLISVFGGVDSTLLLATASVVAILLLLTYRSPFLWLIPLLSVGLANQGATAAIYGLARHAGLPVNGQSGGILPVLVFGVGTDYALLLIARYREELRRHDDHHEAMAFALRQAAPAIVASAATVIIGLLCLLAADLNSNRSLGPVGAVGVAAALLAMLSLLPAVLVIFGRRLFWPFVPRFGTPSHEDSGVWATIGRRVSRRPRAVWAGTALALALLGLGLLRLDTGLAQEDAFRTTPDAIVGQRLIAASFPAGAAAPTMIVASASAADAVRDAVAQTPGVVAVHPAGQEGDAVAFAATLADPPGSEAAFATIDRLRDRLGEAPNAGALVGGQDAESRDVARANSHDRAVIMPLVLVVVLVVIGILLQAVIAPLLLIATVVISYAAAVGASVIAFDLIFGFPAVDPSVPLLGFVFLVALGIDYNIFLMSRVHEETKRIGTRAGMLRALTVTGGVITSAGIVLAATFAVLGVLPLVTMTQLGVLVALGVLLDTLIVRSILVPALSLDIGDRLWWPSRLARPAATPHGTDASPAHLSEPRRVAR